MTRTDPVTGLVLAPAIAWIACVGMLSLLRALRADRKLLDQPNARSLHAQPTPRIGGLGILTGLILGLQIGPGALPGNTWIGLGLIALVSLVDDLRGVPPSVRLILHGGAGALASLAVLGALGPWAWAAASLLVAWSINLYNFMDGSDGLAGVMGLIGFVTLAAVAGLAHDLSVLTTGLVIASACLGFLRFNLPPARVFMGDVGSTALGFLAAALGCIGIERGLWSLWMPVMVFMPFLFDATATLLDRARRGCRLTEAHRDHAYQRLNMAGFGHRKTLLAYGSLMLLNALGAMLAWSLKAEAVGAALSLLIHGILWSAARRVR